MVDQKVQDVDGALGMSDQDDFFTGVRRETVDGRGDLGGVVVRPRPAAYGDEFDRQAPPSQVHCSVLERHAVLRKAFCECAGDDQDSKRGVKRRQRSSRRCGLRLIF
jgi:hypothetical protein